jgi:hypothetical protein
LPRRERTARRVSEVLIAIDERKAAREGFAGDAVIEDHQTRCGQPSLPEIGKSRLVDRTHGCWQALAKHAVEHRRVLLSELVPDAGEPVQGVGYRTRGLVQDTCLT